VKFGPVDLKNAEGAILAHAVETIKGRLKKGKFLGAVDVALLEKSGLSTVIVAILEAGDIEENEAALRIGATLVSPELSAAKPFTGRVNIFAEVAGMFIADAGRVNEINRIDPAITIATLPDHTPVEAGRMVATVKIIPFAVNKKFLAEASRIAALDEVLTLKPYRPRQVGLIATTLPSLKTTTMDKTRQALEARLAPSKSTIMNELRVDHSAEAVTAALGELKHTCDLIIIFGASAIIDRCDVIPTALEMAGGTVEHFGMPVDPGNLLLLGNLGEIPVLGAPGCARSPRQNGFDWILQRVLADIPLTSADIEGLGVGGLLMEIHSRPQPRQPVLHESGNVHAVVLAAGQSRRMGKTNKLLAELGGKPLVRHVVEAAAESRVCGITVVTGHQAELVADILSGSDINIVHNPDFASGLASSLRMGITNLPDDCTGVLILLGDMPRVTGAMIDSMLKIFDHAPQAAIIQATDQGKRGNPVLWSSSYFEALTHIAGDVGARHLIGQNIDRVVEIELGRAASLDIDTPETLRAESDLGDKNDK